ncbi:hypothetical protein HMPREF1580_01188 [Gardnerella vaginalis JCP8070]|nr:hypothetical protein HMPREF1582_00958 [Gardnerella vaginalis JCP8151A]EPI58688.1 hypothetical protein HMPREF1580_01188 [Gardnerella vaginalis JCP8070]EPI60061.1 hypothetical protein HMPREF1579_00598 [Gardnerella vaginalis JCP8066]
MQISFGLHTFFICTTPLFVRDLGQIWYKVRKFFRFLYVI